MDLLLLFLKYLLLICFICFIAISGTYTALGMESAKNEDAYTKIPFLDVKPDHWANASIAIMKKDGIVNGYLDNKFYPNKAVSYGEFIKMVTTVLNKEDIGKSKRNYWATSYYNEALRLNVFTRYAIPEVKLNWQIPRDDMALIIYGATKKMGIQPKEFVNMEDYINDWKFSDINNESSSFFQILSVEKLGILKGYPDGTFKPKATLTRAEATTALYELRKMEKRSNISNLVLNLERYRKEDWIDTENLQYELISKSEAGLNIRVPFNGNLASFDHNMKGFIYLVIEDKIVEYSRSIPADNFITSGSHFDLDMIDYILCIPYKFSNQKIITLVKDPFKRKV